MYSFETPEQAKKRWSGLQSDDLNLLATQSLPSNDTDVAEYSTRKHRLIVMPRIDVHSPVCWVGYSCLVEFR
jgi:hypothetical protein